MPPMTRPYLRSWHLIDLSLILVSIRALVSVFMQRLHSAAVPHTALLVGPLGNLSDIKGDPEVESSCNDLPQHKERAYRVDCQKWV